MRVVVIGSVDHGKSTLIGRLVSDSGTLSEGKLALVAAAAERRRQTFEFANVTDGLQAERDQNVTIDTTEIRLRHPEGEITLIDAPGHVAFLRNMVTGASRADAALLVVDAGEGVTDQTRRHALLLTLLGVTRVVVAVNKIDTLGPDDAADRIASVATATGSCLTSLGLDVPSTVPVSAREGTNVAHIHAALRQLAREHHGAATAERRLVIIPVQDVYRVGTTRVIVGRNAGSGSGDQASVDVWPAGARGTIDRGPGLDSYVLREAVFVSRGDVLASPDAGLVMCTSLHARVFWLGSDPLSAGRRYDIAIATQRAGAELALIRRVVDGGALTERLDRDAVAANDVADVEFRLARPVVVDPSRAAVPLGRIVILDRGHVAGGGVVLSSTPALQSRGADSPGLPRVTPAERAARAGHEGTVVWLTGLPGSGKSTLAHALERVLFDRGVPVVALDGDRLRFGVNADLGFSAEDRSENIRRVAEVARLFAESGTVVITACISPYAADRARARSIVTGSGGRFLEVLVDADLATCEARDPKGLYRKARAGEILDFTGVSAPYERPVAPDAVISTTRPLEVCVNELVELTVGRRRPSL